MLYRLVRPMRRKGSRHPYFLQRIPADVKALAVGLKLDLPVGVETVPLTLSAKAETVKVSLRTADPTEAKLRNAALGAFVETVWRALRNGTPLPLTHRQATALAGVLYRTWAEGEGREAAASTSVTLDLATSKPIEPSGDDESMENVPGIWETARLFLNRVGEANKPWTWERTFGPLIDRLLLARGIHRVDPASREMVMKAFHLALRDGFEARERNAEGDYKSDPKAERFPSFEQAPIEPRSPPPSAKHPKAKAALTALLADWWAEAEAGGRTISTYESYGRTIRQFADFLGHGDASRVTAEDVIRFKDHRIAEGLSLKTVRDSDLAALRSIFSWAVANRRMVSNPSDGVKIKTAKVVRTRAKGFTADEAKALLRQASGYVASAREHAKTAAAKRWAPWLCAYTGARVGEIVQLRKRDIRFAEDGWIIITITPEAGTVKDKEERKVVLHAHLAELGFGDFVRGSKPGYLFLNAAEGADIRGAWRTIKNRLTEFARVVVTDARVAPNHGWRHCFKTIGREVGIDRTILNAICGHTAGSVGDNYGQTSIAAQIRTFRLFPRFET
jgi:integrase